MTDQRTLGLVVAAALLFTSCETTTEEVVEAPAVAYLDKTPAAWIADFHAPDQRVREAAVDALAKLGPDMVPLLAAELDDPDPNVRYSALATLARYDGAALPAAEEVAQRVVDPDPSVRAQAAYVLMKSGDGAASVGTAPLAKVIRGDDDWYVRWRAVNALDAFKASAYPVGYESLRAIEHHDGDRRVREAATSAADAIWHDYWQKRLHGAR
jgi:HEAT repeat protein